MRELAIWMLQWTFSLAGLVHLIGALVLAGAAARFSRSRGIARFLIVASLVWLVASALGTLETMRLRAALAGALWILSIVAVYAIVLGVLVAKAKGSRPIFIATAVLFVLQAPLSWLSALYFTCYIGHDCP